MNSFIEVTNSDGKKVIIPTNSILYIEDTSYNCVIHLKSPTNEVVTTKHQRVSDISRLLTS